MNLFQCVMFWIGAVFSLLVATVTALFINDRVCSWLDHWRYNRIFRKRQDQRAVQEGLVFKGGLNHAPTTPPPTDTPRPMP